MKLEGGTVLIVEDEIIVAFALEDMLTGLGANVVIASTIAEAYTALDQGALALAVLDVNVHGIQSYPLAEELRRRAIPVLFATGYGDAQHPEEFANVTTLTKPYTQAQIGQAIENLP